jgi:uncharacterized protein YndB with AHSA1/START domain
MARMEQSVEINRPVEEVFAYATDIKNWPKWHETLLKAEQTSAGELGVGTTFKGKGSMEGRTSIVLRISNNSLLSQVAKRVKENSRTLSRARRIAMRHERQACASTLQQTRAPLDASSVRRPS